MPDFGNISRVNVRDVWPTEASHFTPWLAENIAKLSETLGMELELVGREAAVGDFSLDILAKDLSTDQNVVIENQFGPTDHDHLGKTLTYAAGFDASTIIWISETVRSEHRQAVEWLNERTDTNTGFFVIEVEVIRIDNSRPAYLFKPIVFPNEWRKQKKRVTTVKNSLGDAYCAFFQALIEEMRTQHHMTNATTALPQNWFPFPSGLKGTFFAASFAKGARARVELYIDTGDADENFKLFDWLYERKAQIEPRVAEEISWERLDEKRACRICIYREGSISDDSQKLKEIHDWMVKSLLVFKQVLSPLLSSYGL